MQDFKRLLVWQAAHRLRLEVRRVFEGCDSKRDFGLRSQIIRAASSIGANIAEGCGKESSLELARFGEMALASAKEVEDHLIEARDTRLVAEKDIRFLTSATEELQRMLTGFVHGVRQNAKKTATEAVSPLRLTTLTIVYRLLFVLKRKTIDGRDSRESAAFRLSCASCPSFARP